jgi:hypothetical protein
MVRGFQGNSNTQPFRYTAATLLQCCSNPDTLQLQHWFFCKGSKCIAVMLLQSRYFKNLRGGRKKVS